MMENPLVVAFATLALLALSAFFVAAEFALLAAKRHRLVDAAATSRSARAALRSADELTVLLAGSQLGITACALALGAITKPAVHHLLTPLLEEVGAPYWVADVVGFVVALAVVTFLHLVVGEMAPKSWAIAHPERSAVLVALPMRGFMVLTRPLLVALNEMANATLRRLGVEPQEAVSQGQTPEDLRQLVEHSEEAGTLAATYSRTLTGALDLRDLTVADVVRADQVPTAVPSGAGAGAVRRAAAASGHLRLLVSDGGAVRGVVHVRDVLTLAEEEPVEAVMRPPYRLDATASLHEALSRMQETSTHLAVVDGAGRDGGPAVVTLADLLRRLLPRSTR